MMKMRLIFIFIYFIYDTYAQTFTCNSIKGYDTKSLTSAAQWQVKNASYCLSNPAATCTFYISFCRVAWMCPGTESSACENATGSSNMTIIGSYTSSTLFHKNDLGEEGFYALFPPGPEQNISNTTYCAPSLRIQFNCNPDVLWLTPIDKNATALAPNPIDIDVNQTETCETLMTFDYAGACLAKPTPSPAPTDKDISPGIIFLIVLFSSALVYFLVGAIYNGLVKHRSGINLLPQAQFWIGLPLHAIEGCRSTLTCCSGTPKPSPATYESV